MEKKMRGEKMKMEKAIRVMRCPKCGHEGYVWKHQEVGMVCVNCGVKYEAVADVPLSIAEAMIFENWEAEKCNKR